jgi:hypothetical protein
MLPQDSAARKAVPLARGCMFYFPDALAAVAELSQKGNDKHNPGQPLHWSREKSNDHADCIARHLIDAGKDGAAIDAEDGVLHAVKVAWRALALAQLAIEAQRKTAPEKDGFIPWLGNSTPPVGVDVRVIVRFRDGRAMPEMRAGSWIWRHTNEDDDIVAYKVVA